MGTNFQVYARHLPPTAGPILGIFFPCIDLHKSVSNKGHLKQQRWRAGRDVCVFQPGHQQKGTQRYHCTVNSTI